jgi:two-component system response regulator ChvI
MPEKAIQADFAQADISRGQILLVDDDPLVCNTLSDAFSDAGFSVETAGDGKEALAKLTAGLKDTVNLIILDVKMPGISGLELLKQVREQGIPAPVIFFTGMRDPIYEQSALELGAVDFVDKTKSFNILLRRVELACNGANPAPREKKDVEGDVISVGDLQLHNRFHRAVWKNAEVKLALSEFAVVKFLVNHAGEDVTHKDIHTLLHGENFAVGYGPEGFKANVRTTIKRIRRKFCDLDESFSMIETYMGFGYRWNAEKSKPAN